MRDLKPESQFPRRRAWCSEWLLEWEAKSSTPHSRAKLYKRFDAKVTKTSACWMWAGAKTDQCYGSIHVAGRTCYAHRIAYERWIGPLPSGSHIDHLCRERDCVNLTHLEAITQKENVRRGSNGALKAHCAQGHPCTEEHIYIRPGNGHKMCGTAPSSEAELDIESLEKPKIRPPFPRRLPRILRARNLAFSMRFPARAFSIVNLRIRLEETERGPNGRLDIPSLSRGG